MEEKLDRIAEALERNNNLFAEWININRANVEQSMKCREEFFPYELIEMKSRAKLSERMDSYEDKNK